MEHTHDCHCGCEHDHGMEERSEEFAKVNADKYHEAFGKFEPAGTNEEVKAQVTALLDKHAKENFTPEVLKKNPRFHRPDFVDQPGYEREYLEDG